MTYSTYPKELQEFIDKHSGHNDLATGCVPLVDGKLPKVTYLTPEEQKESEALIEKMYARMLAKGGEIE